LEVDRRLEITNCFPALDDPAENEGYQLEMMRALRKVNAEVNTVGWYQSAFSGSFLNQGVIKAQYDYQLKIPNSVVVVYDPFRTTGGRLALKAYRLSQRFMRLYAKADFSNERFVKVRCDSRNIFEEVTIKVHNSHLVHGFLYELREAKSMSSHLERLVAAPQSSLEKSLSLLSVAIDEYAGEQSKYQYQQRQLVRHKAAMQLKRSQQNEKRLKDGMRLLPEEEIPLQDMPSRLETFLLSKQISELSQGMISQAMQGFSKYYIIEAIHKRKPSTSPAFSSISSASSSATASSSASSSSASSSSASSSSASSSSSARSLSPLLTTPSIPVPTPPAMAPAEQLAAQLSDVPEVRPKTKSKPKSKARQ